MAASNINRVIITGNLTADPELRSLPSGTSLCKLRVACNTRRKDNSTNEWVDKPNYFDVTVWGAQGENCARYLSKGRPVAIDGRLEWREWESERASARRSTSSPTRSSSSPARATTPVAATAAASRRARTSPPTRATSRPRRPAVAAAELVGPGRRRHPLLGADLPPAPARARDRSSPLGVDAVPIAACDRLPALVRGRTGVPKRARARSSAPT